MRHLNDLEAHSTGKLRECVREARKALQEAAAGHLGLAVALMCGAHGRRMIYDAAPTLAQQRAGLAIWKATRRLEDIVDRCARKRGGR